MQPILSSAQTSCFAFELLTRIWSNVAVELQLKDVEIIVGDAANVFILGFSLLLERLRAIFCADIGVDIIHVVSQVDDLS